MGLVHKPCPALAKAQFRAELARLDDRPVEIRLLERVGEAQLQLVEYVAPCMERHRAADRLGYGPKLIDAVAMISMGVGHDDAFEMPDVG